MFFARSPNFERDIPAQSYEQHISGVTRRQREYLKALAHHCKWAKALEELSLMSGMFHDLGKLDAKNQEVLAGKQKAKKLPIQHCDAGSAILMKDEESTLNSLAAMLVYSHHIGLPNYTDECIKSDKGYYMRDDKIAAHTDILLDEYIKNHNMSLKNIPLMTISKNYDLPSVQTSSTPLSVFIRIALSCLVDADHTDAAVHCGQYTEKIPYPLRPLERLKALDEYVKALGANSPKSQRNKIRSQMYKYCSNAVCDEPIYSCDSPVGTGKTTAIMANLLKVAAKKGLRRIFVILPYTNIINQSVDIYRNSLVLEGENPLLSVLAHHHRAEYDDDQTRQFSVLWNAPIVVTTAVQFFETMAAATPSALRKLHNLPGSAIFIDESHAALPAKLWPQAWQWLKEYAASWNCHLVLASGSLCKFWEIEEFDKNKPEIPEIIEEAFRKTLVHKERTRVSFKHKQEQMDENELCEWLLTLPGPRLLIVNTVQSAAVIAKALAKLEGENAVLHISTALTPKDRGATIEKIKKRLQHKDDANWTLVATSCVEAGVDFSFRTGIREAASFVSLLQTAGRVRRNNEPEYEDSSVWTVELNFSGLLKEHPVFDESSKVLLKILSDCEKKGEEISPSLCTYALKREIRGKGYSSFLNEISTSERCLNFQEVEEKFKVIDSQTVSVVVAEELVAKLRAPLKNPIRGS